MAGERAATVLPLGVRLVSPVFRPHRSRYGQVNSFRSPCSVEHVFDPVVGSMA
jgi:hypothetical protein